MNAEPTPDRRILPTPVGPNAEFYAWAVRVSCDCSAAPTAAPGAMRGTRLAHEHLGAGQRDADIFSWTITHQQLDPAFAVPYAIVVVELEEGPRAVGNLRELEPSELVPSTSRSRPCSNRSRTPSPSCTSAPLNLLLWSSGN